MRVSCTLKRCSWCKKEKPLEDFSTSPTGRFGRHNHCRECAREYGRNLYRRDGLYRRYGITKQFYEQEVKKQNGKCAICAVREIKHIDHDHTTNQYRGLLCQECNTGLGKLGDTIEGVEAALTYLKASTRKERERLHRKQD